MAGQGFKDLIVYKKAYEVAMVIFRVSKTFPKDETFSLTDQIRRSSRSVCANMAEAYRKRQYPRHFVSKLSDADSECAETMVHLDFAKDCNYIDQKLHDELINEYIQVGKMLGGMMNKPEKFTASKLPTATAN